MQPARIAARSIGDNTSGVITQLNSRPIGLAVCLIAVLAGPARAQDRDPFDQGTVGIEAGIAPLVEVWNLNGAREAMLDGSVSFWGALGSRVAIGIEFKAAFVYQDTPGAFVQGISPLVRWKFNDNPVWDWFLEAGPGVSWSDLETPPRGTKFNYLLQAGAGVIRKTGSSQHVVLEYRFLHLSNNGRQGTIRNPDLEMMGVYAGWAFSF